jgi:iron complex transport system ATP-binding protein
MSREFAIEVQALCVAVGGRPVLQGLSLGIRSGEVTAIVGPNGAGKTTLLKALLRLLPIVSGRVHLLGEDVTARRPHQLAGRVGYLEQSPNIYWPLSVEALVALGLKPGQSLDAALDRTGISEFRDRSVLDLSGGERTRALLARVLAGQAPVILADEPTLSLDPRHQIAILECFRRQAREGRCVVLVMHDLLMAEKYADRILVMDRGSLYRDISAPQGLDEHTLDEVFGIARAALA